MRRNVATKRFIGADARSRRLDGELELSMDHLSLPHDCSTAEGEALALGDAPETFFAAQLASRGKAGIRRVVAGDLPQFR